MYRILASFMFFTRLPLWRVAKVPSEYFNRVVECWPLVGLLTGSLIGGVLCLSVLGLSPTIAAVLALCSRVLLTGALHEDGLADFFDGFGGGASREKILEIMKDSHIGTYGVLALIIYFLLMVSMLTEAACFYDWRFIILIAISADVWSKFCSSQIINFLPYARTASAAKNGVVYSRFTPSAFILSLVFSVLPLVFLPGFLRLAALAPVLSITILILIMRKKLSGYTGDCCGASFLICETAFYLTFIMICAFY